MRVVVTLLACLLVAQAWGQATATPKDTDPNLIFDLLGTVNSFEVALPSSVRYAYLVAVQDGSRLLAAEREASGEDVTLTVAAGALAEVTGCSVLLFADLEFVQQDGLSGNRETRCLPPQEEKQVKPHWLSPLARLTEPLDLPLDTWLAVDAFGLEPDAALDDPAAIGDHVVFYLYLSTEDDNQPPSLPQYRTWDELNEAFQ